MIRISKLADYAVVILGVLADRAGAALSASAVSDIACLPEPTVSKVLKLLVRGEILVSTRGMNGGYTLLRTLDDLKVEEIIRAIDGPVSITACADGITPDCCLGETCSLRGRWDEVNTAIRRALEEVTLADMLGAKSLACVGVANVEEKEKYYGGH